MEEQPEKQKDNDADEESEYGKRILILILYYKIDNKYC